MTTKVCNECGIEKDISEFSIGSRKCKECINHKAREYYQANKEKIKRRNKRSNIKNQEKRKQYAKEYRLKNKEKIKEINKRYAEVHKEELKVKNHKYYETHKEQARETTRRYRINNRHKVNTWYKNYRKNNIKLLQHSLSNLIKAHLKSNKTQSTSKTLKEILGYEISDLKKHLESLFEPWMSWENHGITALHPKQTWHIDHIRPINTFNITNEFSEDFKKCWALENLRPLDSYENVRRPKNGEDVLLETKEEKDNLSSK